MERLGLGRDQLKKFHFPNGSSQSPFSWDSKLVSVDDFGMASMQSLLFVHIFMMFIHILLTTTLFSFVYTPFAFFGTGNQLNLIFESFKLQL